MAYTVYAQFFFRQNLPGLRGGRYAETAGLRVRHKQFGIGNIIGVEEQGDDTRVTVRFNAVGVKKLVARYAALEKA